MQEQINKLQLQIVELQEEVSRLKSSQSVQLKGSLDDVQVERVIPTDLTGTTTTNTLLRDVAISVSVPYSITVTGDPETVTGTLTGTGTITVLDYPDRIKIDTWKGQRLAIPVYDATKIIYP